jgi:hypothetical protein
MSPNELSLAIAAAKRLPKPATRQSVTVARQGAAPLTLEMTPRKDGSLLPKGVYRGYNGQFAAKVYCGQRTTKHIGMFPSVTAAVDAIEGHQNHQDNATNL